MYTYSLIIYIRFPTIYKHYNIIWGVYVINYVRGRRHSAIGPTIARSRIKLASRSHTEPYV